MSLSATCSKSFQTSWKGFRFTRKIGSKISKRFTPTKVPRWRPSSHLPTRRHQKMLNHRRHCQTKTISAMIRIKPCHSRKPEMTNPTICQMRVYMMRARRWKSALAKLRNLSLTVNFKPFWHNSKREKSFRRSRRRHLERTFGHRCLNLNFSRPLQLIFPFWLDLPELRAAAATTTSRPRQIWLGSYFNLFFMVDT